MRTRDERKGARTTIGIDRVRGIFRREMYFVNRVPLFPGFSSFENAYE